MQDIVDKNLEFMCTVSSEPDGSFMGCIMHESIGGNAGFYRKYHCAGTHFAYNPENGKILYFDIPTNIPKDIIEHANLSIFRVAIKNPFVSDLKLLKFRIVQHYIPQNSNDMAGRVLLETVRQYNERYGFQID